MRYLPHPWNVCFHTHPWYVWILENHDSLGNLTRVSTLRSIPDPSNMDNQSSTPKTKVSKRRQWVGGTRDTTCVLCRDAVVTRLQKCCLEPGHRPLIYRRGGCHRRGGEWRACAGHMRRESGHKPCVLPCLWKIPPPRARACDLDATTCCGPRCLLCRAHETKLLSVPRNNFRR